MSLRAVLAATALSVGCGRLFNLEPVPEPPASDAAGPDTILDPIAIAQVAAGGYNSCALLYSGAVYCWGGGPGAASDGVVTKPALMPNVSAVHLSVGDAGTCATHSNGTVLCFGENDSGALGVGTSVREISPKAMLVAGGPASDVKATAVGHDVACLLRNDGTVACSGQAGLVGDGTMTSRSVMGDVPSIRNAVAISAGDAHVCALDEARRVRCWGSNMAGQLGTTPSATPVLEPVYVAGEYTAIATGDEHTCGVTMERTMKCWGRNSDGRLGDGLPTQAQPDPVYVAGLGQVVDIACGANASYAVTSLGTLYAWGGNAVGQLGLGTTTTHTTPILVAMLPDVMTIDSGTALHACALANGGVYCWGDNLRGQLGDGTVMNTSAVPRQVSGLP